MSKMNGKDQAKKLKLLLTSIKDKDDTFESNFTSDPRVLLPDPETVSKEEYDYHVNLCMDLDLLEEFVQPDNDWDSF